MEHKNGLLPPKENLRDFMFGDLGIEVSKLPNIVGELPKFNQGLYPETEAGCTFVNAFRQRCHTNGIKPQKKDYINLINYAVETVGYVIGQGRWTDAAMNVVLKFTRIHRPQVHSNYVRLGYDDDDLDALLKRGYSGGVSYGGNSAYNKDYQSDCVLDGAMFGKVTYGHRTCIIKDGKIKVDDSYTGEKFNLYELKQFDALFQNGVYNGWVYVWVRDIEFDESELKRLTKFRAEVQLANKHITECKACSNDEIYKSECDSMIKVNGGKLQTINDMIKSKDMSALI